MDQGPRPIEAEGLFDGLRPRAILWGALVDNVATLVASAVLIGSLAPGIVTEDEEAAKRAIEAAAAAPEFLIGSLVLGLACTVLGGYVGARVAGAHFLRHGGWVAVASAVIAALFYLVPADEPALEVPIWYEIAGWSLLLPAGLLGGLVAKSRSSGRSLAN
ncbi:MAG: hypothetical protein O7G30_02960 [Proteobacteria bacterium]|nr:hypothetical protein [Pseudomonadota bacterium]